MIWNYLCVFGASALICMSATAQKLPQLSVSKYSDIKLTPAEVAKTEALIDQLVFASGDATNRPTLSPGVRDDSDEYRQRFKKVQDAFRELSDLKERAFPVLVEHLDDQRQSINFRNHRLENAVGDACYWCIYYQLQDRPRNYSQYGYSRTGRDGEDHPKPYWKGTPFDESGGIKPWLEENKELKYPEMQIKCLNWLLVREKQIGAPDTDSYFVNILPLEIQILKRQKELDMDVDSELKKLETALKNRDVSFVPRELLPAR
jgi:hypothetical protein